MKREDNRVVGYWQISDYYYIVEATLDEGIIDDDSIKDENTMPLHLEAFNLLKSD